MVRDGTTQLTERQIMAKQQTPTTSNDEAAWSSEPAFFERAIDDKRIVKACIATSPDGSKFVSVREWRVRRDGTPYYTRNNVLVPIDDTATREAFIAALQANPAPAAAPKATAKKVPTKNKAK